MVEKGGKEVKKRGRGDKEGEGRREGGREGRRG